MTSSFKDYWTPNLAEEDKSMLLMNIYKQEIVNSSELTRSVDQSVTLADQEFLCASQGCGLMKTVVNNQELILLTYLQAKHSPHVVDKINEVISKLHNLEKKVDSIKLDAERIEDEDKRRDQNLWVYVEELRDDVYKIKQSISKENLYKPSIVVRSTSDVGQKSHLIRGKAYYQLLDILPNW